MIDDSAAPFTVVSSALIGLKAKDSGMSRLALNELGSLSGLVGFSNDTPGSPGSSRGKPSGSGVLSEAVFAGGDNSDSGRFSEGKLARSGWSEFSRTSAVIETEIKAIKITRKSMIKRGLLTKTG